MDFFSNNPFYAGTKAAGAPSNASFNAGANAGWIDLRLITAISFHIKCDSASGTFVFETTNDEDPKQPTLLLTPVAVVMPAAYNTAATLAASTLNFIFSFGFESANQAAMPQAAWMKCRWAQTGGGSANGLRIGVCRRGS